MSEAQQEKPADAWGQPISEEQQAELQGYLDEWEAEVDHGERKGPFDSRRLTGADVFWLAEQWERDEAGQARDLHLEGADLRSAHLEGAELTDAHLEGADLIGAYLKGADLTDAHLEQTYLADAYLEGASLNGVQLEGADLEFAHLEGADLTRASFDEKTNLDGVILGQSRSLVDVLLRRRPAYSSAFLADIHWGGVDLTRIDWDVV